MKIQKNTEISTSEISEDDLTIINTMAMAEVTKDDIFTFKVVLCDNQIDRDFEAFSIETLRQLANLFVGKTVIKDHNPSSDNQIARIYRTEIQETQNISSLIAYCYMMRTASNADLIKEIQGGIKKEGSVGCAIGTKTCSICGADLQKSYCRHVTGETYKGKLCYSVLSDAQDAYEFSLVAVPAQKNAGISKKFDFEQQQVKEMQIRAKIIELHTKFGGNFYDD
ncbi:MAG: hypothetical protein K2K06_07475 [Oscillospiraceae bacterium]|nr:hypothetical protein [Oscillospiraceae bacterium]